MHRWDMVSELIKRKITGTFFRFISYLETVEQTGWRRGGGGGVVSSQNCTVQFIPRNSRTRGMGEGWESKLLVKNLEVENYCSLVA